MRIGARALGALTIALAIGNHVDAATPTPLEVREIARGVFVHQGATLALDVPGHDDIANIGFVVGNRCVAVIDTGGSMRTGRALRAAIAAHAKKPVCYVINTHVHVDHVLGNAAFKDDKPAFVGNATLVAAIQANRKYFVEHYAADLDAPASSDEIIAPDLTVATTRDLDLGGRTITLRAWPKAHTDSDLTVMVDDARVLWTGDLLFVGRVPALDGSAKGWLAALDALQKTDASIVVPGHGPVVENLRAAIAPERQYLDLLIAGVRKEIDAGKPIEDATAHVGESARSQWTLFDTANPRNVSRVYQELEWE